ncbi:MAG TPA: response regulator, partial [Gemmata sp.]|nr:response regulator [Gemmata sp.]
MRILVVDDVLDAADSTVELLTAWGYDATACYSGASALECARTRVPDAVILDLAMPRMDGFQFTGIFRGLPQCKSIPIIAVSGYSGAGYFTHAMEIGIRHCLLKPINP